MAITINPETVLIGLVTLLLALVAFFLRQTFNQNQMFFSDLFDRMRKTEADTAVHAESIRTLQKANERIQKNIEDIPRPQRRQYDERNKRQS